MEVVKLFGSDDLRFWCGAHASSVNQLLVDIELEGRILLASVPLVRGWNRLDATLMGVIPRDLWDLISNWSASDVIVKSETLFGRHVCGEEQFRCTIRYFARNFDAKSDVVIAAYWLGEAGSVFIEVRYVVLQCESAISTESVEDGSWNSLKIVPLIPPNQRDTYLEPPSALPI